MAAGPRGVTTGIGDDAASFLPRAGYELLVTCDSMVEGRHYLPAFTGSFDIGRRAMTLNISDIGAMGGDPLYALVSLGLPADTLVNDVEELYRGFLYELNPFGASIIGGNLTGSGNGMFIDITLIGEVEQGKAVRRSGARPGDAVSSPASPDGRPRACSFCFADRMMRGWPITLWSGPTRRPLTGPDLGASLRRRDTSLP